MSIEITHLNFGWLPEESLIAIVSDALPELSTTQQADASYEAEWVDCNQKTWALPCYLVKLGSRVVMWSNTDEAGIDDETVADAEDDLGEQVKAFALELTEVWSI